MFFIIHTATQLKYLMDCRDLQLVCGRCPRKTTLSDTGYILSARKTSSLSYFSVLLLNMGIQSFDVLSQYYFSLFLLMDCVPVYLKKLYILPTVFYLQPQFILRYLTDPHHRYHLRSLYNQVRTKRSSCSFLLYFLITVQRQHFPLLPLPADPLKESFSLLPDAYHQTGKAACSCSCFQCPISSVFHLL